MTTVQWTNEHAKARGEGPFRLKGLGGVGNLVLCVQTGGVVVLFANKCIYLGFFLFDMPDAYVCATVRDPRLPLDNGPLRWGCVWAGSLNTHTHTHGTPHNTNAFF